MRHMAELITTQTQTEDKKHQEVCMQMVSLCLYLFIVQRPIVESVLHTRADIHHGSTITFIMADGLSLTICIDICYREELCVQCEVQCILQQQ